MPFERVYFYFSRPSQENFYYHLIALLRKPSKLSSCSMEREKEILVRTFWYQVIPRGKFFFIKISFRGNLIRRVRGFLYAFFFCKIVFLLKYIIYEWPSNTKWINNSTLLVNFNRVHARFLIYICRMRWNEKRNGRSKNIMDV